MNISQARTIAFDVLLRVARQNAYADDALRAELNKTVKAEDAGLATELTFGVLRWQRLLDFLTERYLKKPASTVDIEVRIALRMGLYQLLFLDRVPARAAVHESVELVKRARKRSAATFVNAILRKASKDPAFSGDSHAEALATIVSNEIPLADQLGIRFSHSTWMVERWIRNYGEERTHNLLETNNCAPALSGYLLDPQRAEETKLSLQQTGTRILPGKFLRDSWIFDGGNPGAGQAVRQSWVAIQDEASQAVAHLVAAETGDSVLDLCAAPGGKTLMLARAVGPQGHVIAADLHEHRVRATRERLESAGVRNVEMIALDGSQPLPFEQRFDRILVDVPCSGTGTLARHPEIRWKVLPGDLSDLHARQAALLRNALPHLAPGGRLVYSTCSLEPEENELVVREVLDALGASFQIADPRPVVETVLRDMLSVASVVSRDHFFRTFPPEHGTDGFFAAVIERQR